MDKEYPNGKDQQSLFAKRGKVNRINCDKSHKLEKNKNVYLQYTFFYML